MSPNPEVAEQKDQEEKRPRFNIKLDGTAITALAALLSALGFGTYNQVTQVSDKNIVDVGNGVVEVGEASKDLGETIVNLTTLLKIKNQEIDELYETTDWLIRVVNKLGKRHPADWRKIRREVPDHINLDEETNDDGVMMYGIRAGADKPISTSSTDMESEEDEDEIQTPEELLEQASDLPQRHQFPALDQIRKTLTGKKGKKK
jgi:hypothetical protein